ncbi:phosphoadenosine phosphosulfate reductase family protein [Paenibacillus glucanolyticus]|nr:phosphoadenosine phosphosulfate reductase family protein [Paenibacillus glucanolyticus]
MEQLSLFTEEIIKANPTATFTGTIPSIKPAGESIRKVIENIKEAYLDPSNSRPWVVTTSFGKDSTLLCVCTWVALLETPPEHRTRRIYFISSDTGLEHPNLTQYVRKSIRLMNESAKEQGLDCFEAVLVEPEAKEKFARKVIGHGLVLPTSKSPFRWCTDRWKIAPAERFIKLLVKRFGEVCVMTGVRHAESIKRSNSISKHGMKNQFIFPKTKPGKDKSSDQENRIIIKNRFESHPIADIRDSDLWDYLMQWSKFPWGGRFYEMYSFYSDQGECPMQVQEMKSTCGQSRNGCTLCMMIRDDGMLEHFKSNNEAWAFPVSELRALIQRSMYDARLREPIRKSRIKRLDTISPFTGERYEAQEQLDIFTVHEEKEEFSYEPVCLDGLPAYPDLALGSYSLEARIFLLKNVLHYQAEAEMEFVTPDDIEYIKKVWSEELGWDGDETDIRPEKIQYEGALVLDAEYRLNHTETTIPNLVVDPRYYLAEESGVSLDVIKNLNVLNPDPKAEHRFIYYVTIDFGGGEKDIWSTFEKSKRKTGYAVPYYWQPVTASSGSSNITDYWNNVTVIVCRPEICNLADAQQFVESYIAAGEDIIEPEVTNWERIYWSIIKDKTIEESRRFILRSGNQPGEIPDSIKKYVGLIDEEITIASLIMKSSVNTVLFRIDPEDARRACEASTLWNKVVGIKLSGYDNGQTVREFIMTKGLHPRVLPAPIMYLYNLSEKELFWNYQMKLYGENDVIDIWHC